MWPSKIRFTFIKWAHYTCLTSERFTASEQESLLSLSCSSCSTFCTLCFSPMQSVPFFCFCCPSQERVQGAVTFFQNEVNYSQCPQRKAITQTSNFFFPFGNLLLLLRWKTRTPDNHHGGRQHHVLSSSKLAGWLHHIGLIEWCANCSRQLTSVCYFPSTAKVSSWLVNTDEYLTAKELHSSLVG